MTSQVFDLSTLKSELNNSQRESQVFGFSKINLELGKLQYESDCEKQVVKTIDKWANENPDHTYPKTIKAWLKTISSQKNLRNIVITYDISQLLNNVYLKSRYPQDIVNLYENFIANESVNINRTLTKTIICHFSAVEIFDIITKYNLISIKGTRVYINRFTLKSTLKRNNNMEVDTCSNKKQRLLQ